ncbi:AraC family transcriptional regulator ligand-binding domain-containing protein [Novosphingobium profundi]|uniref:AraC family transcriptional regulator n=1 Tax=Novosphingobium profundi TaxID=1774954 RepID=UPI001BDAD406|nr:AraC family transcriptional regulator [Novosphingobium profundi]MBT0668123.1 AraC family transcriptional regulator ligand-binding domain-containing protein [Novosphingobium profundi]
MPTPTNFPLPYKRLIERGFPIGRLCTRAGVELADRLSTADFFRLWRIAEQEFDDPATGLRFGAEAVSQGYGVAATVALHAPDLRHALAALARYKRLTCPESIDVEVAGSKTIVRYRWLEANTEVPRLLVDMTMASLLALVRRGTADRVAPVGVELARRARHHDLLSQHFGCPITFGSLHDAMLFDSAALDMSFATVDREAFALVTQGLEAKLRSGAGLTPPLGELRVAIARHLSEGRPPHVETVARRLGLSSRTLQRRLGAWGTSFQQQLADVRRTTAVRLLANTELDTVAIAMLLGFIEPNSFSRAFWSWEQTTPSLWREQRSFSHAQDPS